MNVHVNAAHSVGGVTPQQMNRPSQAIAQDDGWFPVEEAFISGGARSGQSSVPTCDLNDPELCQIFAQMSVNHENSKANRHGIVMGAQQEVRTIHDQVAERSRNTQMELSNLARQASVGGMGFSSMGPMGVSTYYAGSGVNTGVGGTNSGSMLSATATAYMNDPRMDDPNYLRTMSPQQLQNMGLDPMMVQLYCNNPSMYPGGLRSMLQNNGSFINPYGR